MNENSFKKYYQKITDIPFVSTVEFAYVPSVAYLVWIWPWVVCISVGVGNLMVGSKTNENSPTSNEARTC